MSATPAALADPAVAVAVFGPASLATIADRFASRGDLMRFYLGVVAAAHAVGTPSACVLCENGTPPVGACVLQWRGTVRVYWVRIALFSSVFLPLVMFMALMPVGIIPLPKWAFGEELAFATHHPVCRACWRRQRARQAMAFAVTLVAGLVLAAAFLLAAITGSLAAACLFGWWDYKRSEAGGSGLIFAAALAVGLVAKVVIDRVPVRVLVPPTLRRVAKRPFTLSDAKLVAAAARTAVGV